VELTSQIVTFAITVVTGMVLGMLFDCYRVMRGAFALTKVITWFTDLLYWLIATTVVFVALLASNWGELRFYVFIGIISGLGVYYNFLSRHAIRLLYIIVRLIIRIAGMLRRIFITAVLKPGVYGIRLLSWPILFACGKCKGWYETLYPKPPSNE